MDEGPFLDGKGSFFLCCCCFSFVLLETYDSIFESQKLEKREIGPNMTKVKEETKKVSAIGGILFYFVDTYLCFFFFFIQPITIHYPPFAFIILRMKGGRY